MTMTLVSTTTVGSGGAASIEFTNIPQTGKDLLVLCSLRTNNDPDSIGYGIANLQFNSNSSNYSNRRLYGQGSSAFSTSASDFTYVVNGSGSTSNTFSNDSFYISNYTSAVAKSASADQVWENNATRFDGAIRALLWNDTAAITNVKVNALASGNFVQHSTASLYIIS